MDDQEWSSPDSSDPITQVLPGDSHVGRWLSVQRAGLLSTLVLMKDLLRSWQVGFPRTNKGKSAMKTTLGPPERNEVEEGDWSLTRGFPYKLKTFTNFYSLHNLLQTFLRSA